MSLHVINRQSIVIANGASNSAVQEATKHYGDSDLIRLYGLLTTDGAITYTIEVSPDNANWFTDQLGDTPADNVPPLQGKSRAYAGLSAAKFFRIHASAPVTADRTWLHTDQVPMQ